MRAHFLFAAVVAFSLGAGCGGGNEEKQGATQAATPARFDPRDSDATFRWLLQVAQPLGAEKDALMRRSYANPLSVNYKDEEKKIEARWEAATKGMIGQGVVWTAVIRKITEEGIYVDGWESGWDKGGAGPYHLYLAFEDGPTSRPTYSGLLKIGKSVDLEEARKMLPGQWVYVAGNIREVRASLSDSSGYISVDVANCKAHPQ